MELPSEAEARKSTMITNIRIKAMAEKIFYKNQILCFLFKIPVVIIFKEGNNVYLNLDLLIYTVYISV